MTARDSAVTSLLIVTLACGSSLLAACQATQNYIVTSTGTSIGLEIAQNPATQTPHAKLGYQRIELALVPTNKTVTPDGTGTGDASQHGEVLMELRYSGLFDLGKSSGIYQRLAVGDTAVRQDGATMLFGRDAEGEVNADTRRAIQTLRGVPTGPPTEKLAILTRLVTKRPACRTVVNDRLRSKGLLPYDELVDADDAPGSVLDEIIAESQQDSACR